MADVGADVTALLPDLPGTDPVAQATRAWLAAGHVDAATPLLVAVSGGADSLALAAAVRTVVGTGRGQRPLAAAVIDHDLQTGSARIASDAAEALGALGYRRVTVRRDAIGTDGGMEAAARVARYDALAAVAADLSAEWGRPAAVLLAHTADDQAETVLLGLGRGSGPRSIAGMSPWNEPWGRPLLGVRRTQTENACATVGLVPWADPHNANPAFTRVRLRREVLPLLDEVLGGGVVPALARTAELMADDLAALDSLADRALAETLCGDGDLDCGVLAAWPSAVRRRVLRHWVRQRAGVTELTYRHLVALEDCVMHGGSGYAVRLPGGTDAVRTGGRLRLPAPRTTSG
jgi:tRNA(Ile)-lysidine synthase